MHNLKAVLLISGVPIRFMPCGFSCDGTHVARVYIPGLVCTMYHKLMCRYTSSYHHIVCCIQHKVHEPQKSLDVCQTLFLDRGWGLGTDYAFGFHSPCVNSSCTCTYGCTRENNPMCGACSIVQWYSNSSTTTQMNWHSHLPTERLTSIF